MVTTPSWGQPYRWLCCLGLFQAWWCHDMETFSTLLDLYMQNLPVDKKLLMWSFDVCFVVVSFNKLLNNGQVASKMRLTLIWHFCYVLRTLGLFQYSSHAIYVNMPQYMANNLIFSKIFIPHIRHPIVCSWRPDLGCVSWVDKFDPYFFICHCSIIWMVQSKTAVSPVHQDWR